jgi:CRP-like cAMP-binding protein
MPKKSLSTFPSNTHNRFFGYGRGIDPAISVSHLASSSDNVMLDMPPKAPASEGWVNWNNCVSVGVRNSPLFAGLPPTAHHELSSKAIKQSFSMRERVFGEGDPIRYLHVIGSGSVKITQLTETGGEVILRVDRDWAPIDEMCSTHEKTHTTSAFSLSDCCILTWYTDEFADLAKRFPLIHSNAIRILQHRLRRLERSFCDLSTARVPQRLARVLLQLAETDGVHTASLGFSRQELAQMAGTSPFMVSRLLSQWAERGIVFVNRSEVTIEDVKTLTRLSEGSPD